jgi:hypothetical protein
MHEGEEMAWDIWTWMGGRVLIRFISFRELPVASSCEIDTEPSRVQWR